MKRRYVLAPEAALDLVQIWRYIKRESSAKIANRVKPLFATRSLRWLKAQASATGAKILQMKQ
jgi:plasmid stabilization system protein ParE